MPRIISFGWTTPALVAGAKTCTRRDWKARYAESFRPGEIVTAYSKNPRAHGHPVARIAIESVSPQRVPMLDAPLSDYAREGFEWFDEHPAHREPAMRAIAQGFGLHAGTTMLDLWREWVLSGDSLYVVRFHLEEVF